uniref:Uncharacterized protein n=1 Tax=Cacopsylla melanoneura TaxID=428564 RepID=A0A8D8M1V6_9HEMI
MLYSVSVARVSMKTLASRFCGKLGQRSQIRSPSSFTLRRARFSGSIIVHGSRSGSIVKFRALNSKYLTKSEKESPDTSSMSLSFSFSILKQQLNISVSSPQLCFPFCSPFSGQPPSVSFLAKHGVHKH